MNDELANLLNRALKISLFVSEPSMEFLNRVYQWRADVREQFELAGYIENADGVFEKQ